MKKITEYFFKKAPKQSGLSLSHIEASQATNISTCQMHEETKYPNIKALEQCVSCQIGMCYICANEHADQYHTIDWGFDIFKYMESPRNETNDNFNKGYRAVVDLTKLKCPCGNDIPGLRTSSICAACGTATCSAECHDKYVQAKGKCLFKRNFVENEQTRNIQGLRSILWINQFAMV